jgi:16S rRNA (guanine966-N2)-methyltransferase
VRIVGGRHKGRGLVAPSGSDTRPTADRARETLFNILAHASFTDFSLVEALVLDAFAGSGAVGLEALSRGAAKAFFFDTDAAALAALRKNIATFGEESRTEVRRADATRPPLAVTACDLIFLDPPYGKGLTGQALSALLAQGWIGEQSLIVAEVAAKEAFSPPLGFTLLGERASGAARFIFLARSSA